MSFAVVRILLSDMVLFLFNEKYYRSVNKDLAARSSQQEDCRLNFGACWDLGIEGVPETVTCLFWDETRHSQCDPTSFVAPITRYLTVHRKGLVVTADTLASPSCVHSCLWGHHQGMHNGTLRCPLLQWTVGVGLEVAVPSTTP